MKLIENNFSILSSYKLNTVGYYADDLSVPSFDYSEAMEVIFSFTEKDGCKLSFINQEFEFSNFKNLVQKLKCIESVLNSSVSDDNYVEGSILCRVTFEEKTTESGELVCLHVDRRLKHSTVNFHEKIFVVSQFETILEDFSNFKKVAAEFETRSSSLEDSV